MTNNFEWEYKAFQEIKQWFMTEWGADTNLYKEVCRVNRQIYDDIKKNNICLRTFFASSKDGGLNEFFKTLFSELILVEPILWRVYIHNSTLPEDMATRKMMRPHLPNEGMDYVFDMMSHDVLVGSDLAKKTPIRQKSLRGIPATVTLTGYFIYNLLTEYEHYRMIDEVKITGATESIEQLRLNRVYDTEEGKVYDYSPILKIIVGDNRRIIECLTENDYNNQIRTFHHLEQKADDILGSKIQKAGGDPRQEEFFGKSLHESDYSFLIRFRGKERAFPFQLLPKWKPGILHKAQRYRLTNVRNPNEQTTEEMQEAMLGLFEGVLTWQSEEGPATSHLAKKIKYNLDDAFEKQSAQRGGERRLRGHIESSGGSLNDYSEDDEDRDAVNAEEKMIEDEYQELLPRRMTEALSAYYKQFPKDRRIIEAFLQMASEGYKQADIAKKLKISTSALSKTLTKFREFMRQH